MKKNWSGLIIVGLTFDTAWTGGIRALVAGRKEEQQQATGISYNFYICQIEYIRNLLFSRGRQMDAVYQRIIDH